MMDNKVCHWWFCQFLEFFRKEIHYIKWSSFGRGILLSFIIFSTRTSMFLTIITYVLIGNTITAEKVFVLTSFYNILKQTMTVFFPAGIAQVAEALISVKRLQVMNILIMFLCEYFYYFEFKCRTLDLYLFLKIASIKVLNSTYAGDWPIMRKIS